MMQKLFEWTDKSYSITLFNDLTCLVATLDGIWVCNAYTQCGVEIDNACIACIKRVGTDAIIKEQVCAKLQGNKMALFKYILDSVISYLNMMHLIDDYLIKRILAIRFSRKIEETRWGVL